MKSHVYDKAAWHREDQGFRHEGLDPKLAGTHIVLYRSWMIMRGFASAEWLETFPDVPAALVARSIGPAESEPRADASIGDADFNEEGHAFTDWYYQRWYADDLQRHLTLRMPSPYHVPDDWASFERLARVLDSRLEDFRSQVAAGEEAASFAENMFARAGYKPHVVEQAELDGPLEPGVLGSVWSRVRPWEIGFAVGLVVVLIVAAALHVPLNMVIIGGAVALGVYGGWKLIEAVQKQLRG